MKKWEALHLTLDLTQNLKNEEMGDTTFNSRSNSKSEE